MSISGRNTNFTKEQYQQYLQSLSLNKARKIRKDKEIDIHEINNRIKKLLLEEQRT